MTIPDAIRPRRPRRATLTLLGGWTGLLLVVGFAVFALRAATDAQHRAEATQSADALAVKQLYAALKTTQDQLTQHGITPKAPPPATIVQGIPGATGQSIVGPQGPAGAAGVSPDPAAIAQMVLAMVHPSPGPVGPVGPAGSPGKDSTVAGPAGPAGPAGVPGSTGPAGQAGSPGAPGAQGPAGPAPSGWTFTAADGTVYDCTPDAAGSTHYSCAARQSPPPPSPSPTPVPSQSATSPKQGTAHRASAPVSTGPGRP